MNLPRFLQRKIDQAHGIIAQGLAAMQQPYCACSWGKDSGMVVYLLSQVAPDVPVVWLRDDDPIPDTLRFRDRCLREWQVRNYVEVPKVPLATIIEEFHRIGLTDIDRTKNDQAKLVTLIKKHPLGEWAEGQGFDGLFWGLRADESRARRMLFRTKSPLYRLQSGEWRCAPIAFWTGTELWHIIDFLGLPYNALYDKTMFEPREMIRNGGWLSTDGAWHGRVVWLKHYYPDLYQRLAAEFPEVTSYA